MGWERRIELTPSIHDMMGSQQLTCTINRESPCQSLKSLSKHPFQQRNLENDPHPHIFNYLLSLFLSSLLKESSFYKHLQLCFLQATLLLKSFFLIHSLLLNSLQKTIFPNLLSLSLSHSYTHTQKQTSRSVSLLYTPLRSSKRVFYKLTPIDLFCIYTLQSVKENPPSNPSLSSKRVFHKQYLSPSLYTQISKKRKHNTLDRNPYLIHSCSFKRVFYIDTTLSFVS